MTAHVCRTLTRVAGVHVPTAGDFRASDEPFDVHCIHVLERADCERATKQIAGRTAGVRAQSDETQRQATDEAAAHPAPPRSVRLVHHEGTT